MAKTNQIGVRFDIDLWEKFDKMGITTAQRKLNFMEDWYLNNLEKVTAFNNQTGKEIENKRSTLSEQKNQNYPLTDDEIIPEETMQEKLERFRKENLEKNQNKK